MPSVIAAGRLQTDNGSCYLPVTEVRHAAENRELNDARPRRRRSEGTRHNHRGRPAPRRNGRRRRLRRRRRRSSTRRAAATTCILLDRDLPKLHGDDVCRTLVARGLAQQGADADRGRHHRAPRRRTRSRRRRLPAQAVRVRRARRAHPRARAAQPTRPATGPRAGRHPPRHRAAGRVEGRPAAGTEPQGASRPRAPARRRRQLGLGRAAARTRLGRISRHLLERRQGHDQPPAAQARRARL